MAMTGDDTRLVLEGSQVDGSKVYVIGSLDHRVTVASQQVRALNLAAALVQSKRLEAGDSAVVIGAGVAGLTAAAGLRHLGISVTVLETHSGTMPLLRGGSTRWLHPGVYDWPADGWARQTSPVPIMRWTAGLVPDVCDQLDRAWDAAKQDIEVIGNVTEPSWESGADGKLMVSWNPGGRSTAADAIILAVGFGLEDAHPGERRYWEADELDAGPVDEQVISWLVSGSGDGALTDVLRLCIEDFRHDRIVDDFASHPEVVGVAEEILRIEDDPSLTDVELHQAYAAIEAPAVRALLEARRRPFVKVTLNAPPARFLDRGASPLNRFLVGQLHQLSSFDVIAGRITSVVPIDGAGGPAAGTGGVHVVFNDDATHPHRFDRVVRRHGPKPALEKFGSVWGAVGDERAERRTKRVTLDQTRKAMWERGTFGPEPDGIDPPSVPSRSAYRAVIVAADDLDDWVTAIDEALTRQRATVSVLRTGSVQQKLDAVADADVLVVAVGHRLGATAGAGDPADEGRSIAELAIETAGAHGTGVIAARVAEDAPWVGSREESDLYRDDVDTDAVHTRVLMLRALKESLPDPISFGSAGGADTPADLGRAIAERAAALTTASPPPIRRSWRIHLEHPLQPAPNFEGRERILDRLDAWLADSASVARVTALVAIGGAGKTAIAERFYQHLVQQPPGGGIFVWSFYENRRTEDFIDAACRYFAGRVPEEPGARLWALKAALRNGDPHILIIDGMERIQSEGGGGVARGTLEDVAMRQMMQAIAAGLGRTRALVTSRFHLADLVAWRSSGLDTIEVDDLEPVAARALLRQWGVRGSDATLDALAEGVGRHALSVAVLGSFIGTLGSGDPAIAANLDLDVAGALDPQANRLAKLIAAYAERMDAAERQVMARLSVFTEGIAVTVLADLVIDGAIGGILIHQDEAELTVLLNSLVARGLVFRYRNGPEVIFSAHPFLRVAFASLLDVPAADIHAAMADRLESGLEDRPGGTTESAELMDRFEALCGHLIAAGKGKAALAVYKDRIGGFPELIRNGRFSPAVRILSALLVVLEGDSDAHPFDIGWVYNELGLATQILGDLGQATRYYEQAMSADISISPQDLSIARVNLAGLLLVLGQSRQAISVAEQARAEPDALAVSKAAARGAIVLRQPPARQLCTCRW